MLDRVSEIYDWVRAARVVTQPVRQQQSEPDTTCRFCVHRHTYLEKSQPLQFSYYCGRDRQEVALEDSCPFFELDPQSIQS